MKYLSNVSSHLLVRRLQNLEGTHESLIDTHHSSRVIEFSAVIWCRENGNQLSLSEELVAVFHDLMRSADQVHFVLFQELSDDVLSVHIGDSSLIVSPI